MGNSHSSHPRLEDDDEQSQAQDVARYLSCSSLDKEGNSTNDGGDISSVVSEPEGHEEQALSPQSPVIRPSNVVHAQASLEDADSDTNPFNLMQAQQQRSLYNQNPWNMMHSRRPSDNDEEDIPVPMGLNINEAPHWAALADTPEDEMWDAQMIAEATCSFLSPEVSHTLLGDAWDGDERVQEDNGRFTTQGSDSIRFVDYSRPAGLFFPWMPPGILSETLGQSRRFSDLSAGSNGGGDTPVIDFYPPASQNYEWMGRSIETLLMGHCAASPVLALPEAERVEMVAKETSQRPEGGCTRRTSVSSLDAHRSPHRAARRTSLSHGASYPRRSSSAFASSVNASGGGPNVLLSLLAREGTGKPTSRQTVPPTRRLREMGGAALYNAVDTPSGGIVSEVALLEDAIDRGDWTETQIIISRLAPRLVGDPSLTSGLDRGSNEIDDPSLPASASRFYAGGGRLGLEREAFVLSGGVKLLLRVFKEPAFVGDEVIQSNDARDLSDEIIQRKLASCWNEVFASLRELVYALPLLVENGEVLDGGDFVPFLFTLLAHDHCFDGAAALMEEILSSQSNSQQPPSTSETIEDGDNAVIQQSRLYNAPASTFFLGNVPDLYKLFDDFNCRQLAHFCRLLALLVFEPEDRQVLDSPSVLRSVELLQIRRDRAARAGRDSTVDMNQAILIGDVNLMERLLVLLRVMNFAPPLTNSTPYHVITHFPFISGTLPMVGLSEISDFQEVDRLESLARTMISQSNNEAERLSDLGTVTDMLESLSVLLRQEYLEQSNQIGHIINVINAAQQAGVVVGMPNRSRRRRSHESGSRERIGRIQATSTLDDHSDESEGVQVVRIGLEGGSAGEPQVIQRIQVSGSPQMRINSPEDAANELQFNAFMLAPYQVEVLFVLCTLLGGRRKIDTQNILKNRGLVNILDELFHRLPFGSSRSNSTSARGSEDRGIASSLSQPQEETHGIHGPGCECTPESAMSVQFLRLLHNFCDRDSDNHNDRRLLLSMAERELIFSKNGVLQLPSNARPGLLSKVIQAFMTEPDDSPYRFWLASCVESFLRGSSTQEQLHVAHSGLLFYLVEHVTSDRLHCAGSLQTSFDLLGELCKGNCEVLQSLVSRLDELTFQRLMKVAASNLVDSNVFVRSLILSAERHAALHSLSDLQGSSLQWKSKTGPSLRFYLTHSWWNPSTLSLSSSRNGGDGDPDITNDEKHCDNARPSDWFPPFRHGLASDFVTYPSGALSLAAADSHEWIFSPGAVEPFTESEDAYLLPTTLERLRWFLDINRTQLLRELFGAVSLKSINHENICCLNTAIIVMIFAHRRGELCELLISLKATEDERRRHMHRIDNGTIIERMQGLDVIDRSPEIKEYESSLNGSWGADTIHNFRELLWFWTEYYTHRGRDRISLEFSSHTHFREWRDVVSILSADDGSSASLVAKPPRLPRSPYQCAPRVFDVMDSHLRGA